MRGIIGQGTGRFRGAANALALMAVGIIVLSAWGLSRHRQNPERRWTDIAPATSLSLADLPSLGSQDAPVIILEFSDFQCPYCRAFAQAELPRLREGVIRQNTVRFLFRNFPLEAIHPAAVRAAMRAECGRRLGKFWDVHDALFGTREQLTEELVDSLTDRFGLVAGSPECGPKAIDERVRADRSEAAALGLRSTPTFLVGRAGPGNTFRPTKQASGALSADELERIVAEILGGVMKAR